MSAAPLDDLAAEYDALHAILVALTPAQWDAPTPAASWAVRDQIAHLAFGEELAALACTDPDAFGARLTELLADLDAVRRDSEARARRSPPDELLADWRVARQRTLEALRAREPAVRVPWVTGSMSVASFATARLMETWAHGLDVRDAVGVEAKVTPRLKAIAHLGVVTRAFAYRNRGMEPPAADVRVVLLGTEDWVWGPENAPDRVEGPALDFCQVVTQRRHVDDTALRASGPHAREWLLIAQCFAGPPTTAARSAARNL